MSRRSLAVATASVVVLAVSLLVLGPFTDGDSGGSDEARPQFEVEFLAQRKGILAAVRDRRLPAIAREMYPLPAPRSRLYKPDVIPRPEGDGDDEDVIRIGGNGSRGPKLQWDLDQDGRIRADEREITEQELFTATYEWRDYGTAARRRARRVYVRVRQRVLAAVRARELPRAAAGMVPSAGTQLRVDFLPRPDGDGTIYTVIGIPFDLDRDGRISRDERKITEYDLFRAISGEGSPGGGPSEEGGPA